MNDQHRLNLRFYCLNLATRSDLSPEQIIALAESMEAYLLNGLIDKPEAEVAPAAEAEAPAAADVSEGGQAD